MWTFSGMLISTLLSITLASPATSYDKTCLVVGAVCDSMLGPQGTCCEGSYCPPPILDVSFCTPLGGGGGGGSCAITGRRCDDHIDGIPCCDGNLCDLSLNGGTCVSKPPECLGEKSLCAGPGMPEETCCSGLSCTPQAGNTFSICSSALPCLSEGDICVGIDGPRGTCCGDTECVFKAFDLSVCEKKVDPALQCRGYGDICSELWGDSGKCCNDLTCQWTGPGRGRCQPPFIEVEGPAEGCVLEGGGCTEAPSPEGGCCPGLSCRSDHGPLKCRPDW